MLPQKEYLCLDELEERWDIQRRDTIYYAENGLLAVTVPATALRIEIGQVAAIQGHG